MRRFLAELAALGVDYRQEVLMSANTSFKIGGPAALVLYPASLGALQGCVALCAAQGLKPFVLGNGSNLLVKDSGIDGVVISTEKLQTIERLQGGVVACGAGIKLNELCVFAQKNGLSGLEFAYGIPGSVGGAVFMNAGAYGGEMKEVLGPVTCVTSTGACVLVPPKEQGLGYRHSAFMEMDGIVASACFLLAPGNSLEIKAKMNETMQKRRDKQPLEFASAGSVFKRPAGHFAGGLIEQCGLKGKGVGGAQVSEKHAGFIINTGGARAADVRALIALVQEVVQRQTGVLLEPEIRFV
ncbi:MAG: UDP-N-acetylmuramate dehydrogenase [Oscillospiraceae bacterium]|jgi:UDP-N-acetylmuramate dehydrogenase|nr:UDP-N-acetylmuramate dehydrogenase [Oscillospiraceae bacterium]